MKKVFLFATLAVAAVFNLGYVAYGKYKAMSQADKLVFENIEALSDGEIVYQDCSRAKVFGKCYIDKEIIINGIPHTMPSFVGMYVDEVETYQVAVGSPQVCEHIAKCGCPSGAYRKQ